HRVGGIEEHCLVHVVFLWNGKRFTALSYGRFGSSVASLPLPGINSVASAEPSYPCGAPPDGMTYSGELRRGGAEGLRVGVLDVLFRSPRPARCKKRALPDSNQPGPR